MERYSRNMKPSPFFQSRQPRPPLIYWTTGDGESVPLHEMEDSHLQNTLNYITRRSQDWESVKALAYERTGRDLGEFVINGKPASEWFDLMTAEVARRQDARS